MTVSLRMGIKRSAVCTSHWLFDFFHLFLCNFFYLRPLYLSGSSPNWISSLISLRLAQLLATYTSFHRKRDPTVSRIYRCCWPPSTDWWTLRPSGKYCKTKCCRTLVLFLLQCYLKSSSVTLIIYSVRYWPRSTMSFYFPFYPKFSTRLLNASTTSFPLEWFPMYQINCFISVSTYSDKKVWLSRWMVTTNFNPSLLCLFLVSVTAKFYPRSTRLNVKHFSLLTAP